VSAGTLGDAARGANLGRRGDSAIDSRTTRQELCHQPEKRKRIEECFGWLKTIAFVAQSSASRNVEVDWDLHVRLRGLQPGAHAEPDAQRSSDVVSPGRSVFERR